MAAGAAVVLALGVGLLVWAVTPQSGGPLGVLRGALGGLGAANLVPPSIGGISVTLPPLLLTALCAALVASAAIRRDPALTLLDELVGGVVAALVYSVVVVAVVTVAAPAGTVDPGQAWVPAAFAVCVAVVAVFARGGAGRDQLRALPGWVITGLVAGAVTAALVTAVGAVVLAVGLGLRLGAAADLAQAVAPGVGPGIGLAVLGIVLLPDAAVAGAAWATGVGFRIGTGQYSPLGTTATELPPLPLLAAVPPAGGATALRLAVLAGPVLVAALVGVLVRRRTTGSAERARSVATAALTAAVAAAALAALSRGGLVGADRLELAVPVLPFAAAVGLLLALVGGAVALVPTGRRPRTATGPGAARARGVGRGPDDAAGGPDEAPPAAGADRPGADRPDADADDPAAVDPPASDPDRAG